MLRMPDVKPLVCRGCSCSLCVIEEMDYLVEFKDKNIVLIDSAFEIQGYIAEKDVSACPQCNSEAIYYESRDAFICAYCNIWLEKRCGDSSCEYCIDRPEKPIPNENELRKLRNERRENT